MLTFFVALAVVAVGYYVAWPLLQGPSPAEASAETTRELRAVPGAEMQPGDEATRLQRVLAEIDFDHSTGKTNDEDWQLARAPIEAQLEQLATTEHSVETSALDRELELEIHIARARLRLRGKAQTV